MLANSDRQQIYSLLSYLFCPPDADTAEVVAGINAENLHALLPDVATPPNLSATDLDPMQAAYTALFVNRSGGVAAPPYGSVYLDGEGQLMGASTHEVAQLYTQAGLSVEDGTQPPDYLPIELEFLCHLVELEDQALGQEDDEAAGRAVELQRAFIGDLVLPWIGLFCSRLQKNVDTHPLYLWSAELLISFLATEKERLYL